MLGLTLPDSFTPDNVRTISLVIAIASIVLVVLVLRFVQKVMMKLSLTALLVLVAFGAWHYRADLGDCAKTCKCRVLGIDITIPKGDLPNAGVGCASTAK